MNEKVLNGPAYTGLQTKLVSEFNKIVSAYYNHTSKTTNTENKTQTTTPASVKYSPTLKQNLNLKEKAFPLNSSISFEGFSNLNSNDRGAQEKLSTLCNSIEKASSNLIKSNLISELFKILYVSDSDIRHLIYKKQQNLVPTLLRLRKCSKERQEKNLNGNINECLALLGHVEPHPYKGVNILSLDGGGKI